MSKEIMQQALDALDNHNGNYKLTVAECKAINKVCDNLRQALAQPDKPLRLSPVYEYGHIHEASQPEQEELIQFKDGKWSYVRKPWVGLTDEEIKKIMQQWRNGYIDIKDVEQLLKEKNNAV